MVLVLCRITLMFALVHPEQPHLRQNVQIKNLKQQVHKAT